MINAGDYTISFDGQLSYMVAADEKSGHEDPLPPVMPMPQAHSMGRSPGCATRHLWRLSGPFRSRRPPASCSSSRQTILASAQPGEDLSAAIQSPI